MKVCILTSSAGGGHTSAAIALRDFFLEHGANCEVFDTYKTINPLLNKLVNDSYEFFASKTPNLYRAAYEITNKKNGTSNVVAEINKMLSRKILKLLNTFEPDIIIATHPFSAEIVSKLKTNKKINIPIICVITDYAPHRTWINSGIDAYITGHECMNEELLKLNVAENKIFPFGIPVKSPFYKKISESEKLSIKRELNLDDDKPAVLIMAGSWGFGNDILEIYKYLNYSPLNFQIVIITGKNLKLFKEFKSKCEFFSQNIDIVNAPENTEKSPYINEIFNENINKIKEKFHEFKTYIKDFNIPKFDESKHTLYKKNVKLLYFTDKINKYMAASDVIITKPGGLTTTEAINRFLPIIIINPVPGQEEKNTEFLLNQGIGIKPNAPVEIIEIVDNLLNNQKKLMKIKNQCEKCKKSNTLINIFELSLKLCKN